MATQTRHRLRVDTKKLSHSFLTHLSTNPATYNCLFSLLDAENRADQHTLTQIDMTDATMMTGDPTMASDTTMADDTVVTHDTTMAEDTEIAEPAEVNPQYLCETYLHKRNMLLVLRAHC